MHKIKYKTEFNKKITDKKSIWNTKRYAIGSAALAYYFLVLNLFISNKITNLLRIKIHILKTN